MHKLAAHCHVRMGQLTGWLDRFAGQRGQGTVEYVGLILLVSLLMVGMVAAMKGFRGSQGTELAEVIVNKIKSAVEKVSYR